MGKRRVNFQRCWLPVSRIGLHRRGVERVNCGPKLLDLGEKGVYSSYTYPCPVAADHRPPARPRGRGYHAGRFGVVAVRAAAGVGAIGANDTALQRNN